MVKNISAIILFVLGFVCACAEGSDSDTSDIDMPPVKRSKLQAAEMTLISKKYKARGERGRALLDIIHACGEKGCHYTQLKGCMSSSRSGALAVLESVVNMMFLENTDIHYNDVTQTYKYLGPAPTITPPLNLPVALARIFSGPHGKFACEDLGMLAYSLFKHGYRATNYSDFMRTHAAVRVLCDCRLTRLLLFVKDTLDFIEHFSKDPRNFAKALQFYCAQRNTTVSPQARIILKYIVDLDKDSREEIDRIAGNTVCQDAGGCERERPVEGKASPDLATVPSASHTLCDNAREELSGSPVFCEVLLSGVGQDCPAECAEDGGGSLEGLLPDEDATDLMALLQPQMGLCDGMPCSAVEGGKSEGATTNANNLSDLVALFLPQTGLCDDTPCSAVEGSKNESTTNTSESADVIVSDEDSMLILAFAKDIGLQIDDYDPVDCGAEGEGIRAVLSEKKPLELAVAEAMCVHKIGGFDAIAQIDVLKMRAQSLDHLKGIYWALRAVCSEGRSVFKKSFMSFRRFVRENPWAFSMTVADQCYFYMQETQDTQPGQWCASERWRLGAQVFAAMDQDVVDKLMSIKIPVVKRHRRT